MNIRLIDPFTDKRWDNFVFRHPEGTIFHHSAWARVLQERYCSPPAYYALENSAGEITAIAPFFIIPGALKGRRMVCLPSSEYCFPLADDPQDLKKLIVFMVQEADSQGISFLEIRGLKGIKPEDQLPLKEYPYYLNHVTELKDDASTLMSRFSRETRYHINRGEKSPVIVRPAGSEADLAQFHQLTTEMRRKNHLLPWPFKFFKSIYQNLVVPGLGSLLLAELGGRIVSGGVFFKYKDTVINKFNASDARYIQLRTNYLLMWKAIEWAFENSCHYFDFGVTNPENAGLIKFKSHWNSQQTVLPYYYYPDVLAINSKPERSLAYRTYITVNKLLPGFALKLAAELLYKRLG